MKYCKVKYEHLRAYLLYAQAEAKELGYLQIESQHKYLGNYIRYQHLYYAQDSFDLTTELEIDEASFFEWFFDNNQEVKA